MEAGSTGGGIGSRGSTSSDDSVDEGGGGGSVVKVEEGRSREVVADDGTSAAGGRGEAGSESSFVCSDKDFALFFIRNMKREVNLL